MPLALGILAVPNEINSKFRKTSQNLRTFQQLLSSFFDKMKIKVVGMSSNFKTFHEIQSQAIIVAVSHCLDLDLNVVI